MQRLRLGLAGQLIYPLPQLLEVCLSIGSLKRLGLGIFLQARTVSCAKQLGSM